MSASNNTSILKKFISNFLDLTYGSDSDDIDAKKKALIEEGVDIEGILMRQMEVIDSYKSRYLLGLANEEHKSFIKQFVKEKTVKGPSTREEKIKMLSSMFSGESSSQTIQALFHKFEFLADEDLDSMIEDAQILKRFNNQKK